MTFKGAKYGAFAGLIATWSISSAIAASELALGLQIGTFYSIIGISLGLNNVITAASLGFGFHLLTGTALGAVLGAVGIRWKKIRMLNPYKSAIGRYRCGSCHMVSIIPSNNRAFNTTFHPAYCCRSSGFIAKNDIISATEPVSHKHISCGNFIPYNLGSNIWVYNRALC